MKLITALVILCSASLLAAMPRNLERTAGKEMEQQWGQCGPNNFCPGRLCCSAWGFCGSTEAHCSPRNGCKANCWPAKAAVDDTVGQTITCGRFRPCPGTMCCSLWGFCGTTEAYCSPNNCQSKCWPASKAVTDAKPASLLAAKASASLPPGSCNRFTPCPGGLCCSAWGFCGTTAAHCSPANGCQSNCWRANVELEGTTGKDELDGTVGQTITCGRFRPCPGTMCCSLWGFCGTTEAYCSPNNCQSKCWPALKAVTDA